MHYSFIQGKRRSGLLGKTWKSSTNRRAFQLGMDGIPRKKREGRPADLADPRGEPRPEKWAGGREGQKAIRGAGRQSQRADSWKPRRGKAGFQGNGGGTCQERPGLRRRPGQAKQDSDSCSRSRESRGQKPDLRGLSKWRQCVLHAL